VAKETDRLLAVADSTDQMEKASAYFSRIDRGVSASHRDRALEILLDLVGDKNAWR
jgi:hypothetical protein